MGAPDERLPLHRNVVVANVRRSSWRGTDGPRGDCQIASPPFSPCHLLEGGLLLQRQPQRGRQPLRGLLRGSPLVRLDLAQGHPSNTDLLRQLILRQVERL